jgi:hypothetical protein
VSERAGRKRVLDASLAASIFFWAARISANHSGAGLLELAMSLLVMSRTEPHDAFWVTVVDVVALGRLGAADLAGLAIECALADLVSAVASSVGLVVLCSLASCKVS